MSNRPPKYKKRIPTAKDMYSVRSLVPEITGILEGTPGFDAALKEVQRIIMTLRKTTGDTDKSFKVAAESKPAIVFLTKAFLPGGEFRSIYEKNRDSVTLTEKEQIQQTDLHMQGAKLNNNTESNILLLERAEAELEFIEVMDDITSILQSCIESADNIEYHVTKVNLVKSLRDQVKQVVDTWRNDMETALINEAISMRIIELGQEKGYLEDDILGSKLDELRNQVLLEYLPDTESLIQQLEQELKREQ